MVTFASLLSAQVAVHKQATTVHGIVASDKPRDNAPIAAQCLVSLLFLLWSQVNMRILWRSVCFMREGQSSEVYVL